MEYKNQVQNAEVAELVGISKDNIILKENGDVVTQRTEGGVKYNFEGSRYIVRCDKVAGYLRIYDKKEKSYCLLDGTLSKNPEKTHFKIKRREEM